MRVLVIGLGSMGKRRIRNLRALGLSEIIGFDPRADRRQDASEKYSIQAFDTIDAALKASPQALVISTPPDKHMEYAYRAFELGLPCFIEASVVDAERILELSRLNQDRGLVIAPSCTMRYFPGPAKVKELIQKNVIGKPLAINYYTGQYLPDWHPWEPIADYYVSHRETGGGREIVPFELTWLNDIFGSGNALACYKNRMTAMDADIDDIYCCIVRYTSGPILNLTVDVISRPTATRELRILGESGQIVFSGDENCVRYINTEMEDWDKIFLDVGSKEANYINPEEPYISEMKDFLLAVETGNPDCFPNTLSDDYEVLQLLASLETKAVL